MKITPKPGRVTLGRLALSCALVAPLFANAPAAFAASGDVAPGTAISNTATASYTDGSGNNYSTNSNTVTTTVQNAPSVAITAGTGSTYAPGQAASDTYTITNTGNAAGNLQFPTIAVGGTDTPASAISSYVVTLPNGTPQTFTTLGALNTYLNQTGNTVGVTSTATPNTVTLVVNYTVPAGAGTTAGANTYTTNPSVTITQPANGANAPAETSTPVNAIETDTVGADARLDLQKSVPSTTATTISYQIAAGDGSLNFKAKDLVSAQTLLNAGAPGILITDKIPQFTPTGGTAAPLTFASGVTIATSAANGYLGGTATIYYTANANGTAGWTALGAGATPPAGTTYIGVYLSGGTGGFELGPDSTTAAGLSTPGTVPNPGLTASFVLNRPSATAAGSGNFTTTNLANGIIGSNQATETILGPGIPAGTTDSAANVAQLTNGTQGINNVTPSTTGAPVNEASNQTSTTPSVASGVLNGPAGVPGAVGSYNGTAAVNNSDDFTDGVLSIAGSTAAAPNASTNSSTTAGAPTGNASGAATAATVTNSLNNTGNAAEAYTLTFGTLPAGITVTGVTVNGTALTGSQAAGFVTPSIPSQGTINYVVSYAGTAAVPTLTANDVTITATGNTSGDLNTTHNELYDGFIALTKSQALVSGCSATTTPAYAAGTVCPGGTITYTIDYRNIAQAATGTGNTEPAAATAAVTAANVAVTENGFAGTNTWATNTNGLNATPTSTSTGGTVATFGGYQKGTTNANQAAQTTAPGATTFVATVGTMAPAAQGTFSFAVTVK